MANLIRESKVEKRLFDGVKLLKGKALKITKVPGWPDRLVLLKPRIGIFTELKRPKGGVVAEHQEVAHEIIRGMGFEVEILWNYEMVDDFLFRCSQRVTSMASNIN